ncbi:copper resistance CopC family protein [Streptomyces sp. OR43]|uniref:copper resistance CopC family protein n=1 Tax=Streptomyces sp. or43 TaxID=2478957 RepID=UPI003967628E
MNWRAARAAARTLVVPLAGGLLWAAAPTAAAHTDLLSSNPADAVSLGRMPDSIRLTFSDEMSQLYAKVALTSPDGTQGGAGRPEVVGKTVTLAVQPGLPPGRYTVGYRVVSADGHPVAGSYRFSVREQAATPLASAAPAPSSPSSSSSSSSPAARSSDVSRRASTASSSGLLPALAVAGVLVVGVGGVALYRRRSGHGG